MPQDFVLLKRDDNQARGLAQYALDFLTGRFGPPGEQALQQVGPACHALACCNYIAVG